MAARTPEPVLLLLLVLWAASVSFPADAAVRNLVVVGGNLADDNDAIYGAFIDLAGGPGAAVVGVVTAASSEPTQSWIFYRVREIVCTQKKSPPKKHSAIGTLHVLKVILATLTSDRTSSSPTARRRSTGSR